MTATIIRRVVLAVCAVGIAGMIVTSIAGSTGGAITFGLVTAVAVLCSIVATSVTAGAAAAQDPVAEDVGARVEQRVEQLVAAGADENEVRTLVADAVRLGRVIK